VAGAATWCAPLLIVLRPVARSLPCAAALGERLAVENLDLQEADILDRRQQGAVAPWPCPSRYGRRRVRPNSRLLERSERGCRRRRVALLTAMPRHGGERDDRDVGRRDTPKQQRIVDAGNEIAGQFSKS
jgi:hypothetical protein